MIVLNTEMEILKIILCSIGSQCSCLRIGVMWINFMERVITLLQCFIIAEAMIDLVS